MSSRARRPYLMGNKSVTEFYQAPVRYLKEVLGRESEFEKPYVDEEYRKMHFDFPVPDWPPFPPISPWPPLPPIDGPVPGLPGCAIVCYPPGSGDCDEPIWCHPGIWCGTDLGCTLCTWEVEGATSGYTPHLSGVGSWGIDVWISTDLVESGGEALIRICMTDPCNNVCCHDSEVVCKVCPPEVVMTWDSDVSAETIGAPARAGVYIKDGLGPYQWSVAGTGFTMEYPETGGVTNILIAASDACGTATITVTDFCEDTVVGYVRCTAGHWVPKETCTRQPVTCGGLSCGTCTDAGDIIVDYKRWRLVDGFEYMDSDPDCPPTWAGCSNPPPCGSPVACATGTACQAGRTCHILASYYEEWECV